MNKLIKIFTDYLPILFLDFTDQEAVQRFFLQEVQLGEELLAQGDIEAGVSVPFKHGILTLSNFEPIYLLFSLGVSDYDSAW